MTHPITRFYLLEFIKILEEMAPRRGTEIDGTGSYFNRDSRPSVARKSIKIASKLKIIRQPFCIARHPSYNIQSKLISGESGVRHKIPSFHVLDREMRKFCYAKVLHEGTLCFMDLMKKIFASLWVFFFNPRQLLFILSGTNYVSRHRLVLFSCKTLLSRLKQRWKHLSIRPPNILGLLTYAAALLNCLSH